MSTLQEQAEQFAATLTNSVRYVAGPSCPAFAAVATSETDRFLVRQAPDDGVVLFDDTGPILRLEVSFGCVWDSAGQYLAVEQSRIAVFAEGGTNPLFRYEFSRNLESPNLPSAHIHFHGTHSELERAMANCGSSTPRAKRRLSGKKLQLSTLHFPVGGARFRPCLEDVLQMLIEEFGVKTYGGSVKSAIEHLSVAREQWRRDQVKTCVRDSPEDAALVLRALGYSVEPPQAGPAPARTDRLQAI